MQSHGVPVSEVPSSVPSNVPSSAPSTVPAKASKADTKMRTLTGSSFSLKTFTKSNMTLMLRMQTNSLCAGDRVVVTEKADDGWWSVRLYA